MVPSRETKALKDLGQTDRQPRFPASSERKPGRVDICSSVYSLSIKGFGQLLSSKGGLLLFHSADRRKLFKIKA